MENNCQEVWKPIDGFEGLYEVSNLGRVKSLDRYVDNGHGSTRLAKGRILKPQLVMGGYLQVVLCKDGKQTIFKVHRLVAKAFQDICGQFIEELDVDHINTIRTDNRAINLRWCTRKENCNNQLSRKHYSDANKGEKNYWYGKSGKSNPASKAIIQFDRQGNFIAEHESLMDAELNLGIHHQSISACCKGKLKSTGGYKWKYKIE